MDEVRARGILAFAATDAADDIPDLSEATQTLFPSGENRTFSLGSLRELIRLAISRLTPDYLRRAAAPLFGIDDHKVYSLTARQERAAKECQPDKVVSQLTFRQNSEYEETIIRKIADATEQIIGEAATVERDTPTEPRPYVHRRRYHQRIRSLISSGTKVIILHGDAGTGKSTLARAFAQTYVVDRGRIATIDLHDRDATTRAMADYLARGPGDTLDHLSIERDFHKLLTSAHAPLITILDNAESLTRLDNLIPSTPANTIIVTTRRRLDGVSGSTLVEVGNMSHAESVEMAMTRGLHLSQEDASLIARKLDHRPLAIEHACGLLRENPWLIVTEFCRALRDNIAEALSSSPEEPTLTAVYRMELQLLDENARRMLDYIAQIPRVTPVVLLNLELGSSEWFSGAEAERVSPLVTLRLYKNLRQLQRSGLIGISVDDNTRKESAILSHEAASAESAAVVRNAAVSMHLLTRQIIQDIRGVSGDNLYRDIARRLDNMRILQNLRPGQTIPWDWMGFAGPLGGLAGHLEMEEISALPWAVALALRYLNQVCAVDAQSFAAAIGAYQRLRRSAQERGDTEDSDEHPASQYLRREMMISLQLNPRSDGILEGELMSMCGRFIAENSIEWHIARLLVASDWHRPKADPQYAEIVPQLTRRTEEAFRSDPPLAAQLIFAGGTFNYDCGDWSGAARCYGEASRIWMNLPTWEHWKMEVLRGLERAIAIEVKRGRLEAAWYRFKKTEEVVAKHFSIGSYWDLHAADSFNVVFSQILLLALVSSLSPSRSKLLPGLASVSPSLVIDFCKGAADECSADSAGRILAEIGLRHNQFSALALVQPTSAVQGMSELAARAGTLDSDFASLRCELSANKIKAAIGGARVSNGVAEPIVADLVRLAQLFIGEYRARYWYADAIASAYILGKWAGLEVDRLPPEEQVVETLSAVDRLDKLELVRYVDRDDFSPLWLLGN